MVEQRAGVTILWCQTTQGPAQQKRAFAVTYILSATSACAAEAVTFPLDIIKTRLQVCDPVWARACQSLPLATV
jgi:hypothetical protein